MSVMKTNLVDYAEAKTVSAERATKTKLRWPLLVLVLISAALGAGGCEGYYSASPGYVTVEVGDRPYYVHGPGYYVGHTYYVWRPGHWAWRHGQRVWIRGHYVVRGY